jgi:subtilisin family serine protease
MLRFMALFLLMGHFFGEVDSLIKRNPPYFRLLKVKEAWKITKGSPDILVGVIDLGFDFYHPFLKERIIPGYFADGTYHTEVYGVVAHGTLVTSLILSLAPECKILTASIGTIENELLKLKKAFFEKNPEATMKEFQAELLKHREELAHYGEKWLNYVSEKISEAIKYLVDRNVKVINISALLKKDPRIEEAFSYASKRDVVIVIGAGNSNIEYTDYPGDTLSNVIVVGASNLMDERWEIGSSFLDTVINQGSNYGPRLMVMAPAESLVIAVPHEERFYHSDDGPLGATDEEFNGLYEIIENGATSSATAIVTSLVPYYAHLNRNSALPRWWIL